MTLRLISIGLRDHMDLSLRALDAARQSDHLFVETYTMRLETSPEELTDLIGKQVEELPRGGLEEEAGRLIELARGGDVAVLVGGDALAATTHISLVVEAVKQGVPVKVVHGSSVVSAVAETGLSLYKFGRTVTVPLPEKGPADTVVRTIEENMEHGLHTLILLDLDMPGGRFLTIRQAIGRLEETGRLSGDALLVGVARLGSENPVIKADVAARLKGHDFGEPPHALVAPGQLHFVEEEALRVLAGCPPEPLDGRRVQGEVDRLAEKYGAGCRRVLEEIRLGELPATIGNAQVGELLDHARRYVDDAEYYRAESKPVALAGVAYAEGILDALKLLGLVEFEW